MKSVTPFLMFQHGQAEPALNLYVAAFPDAEILSLERFGPEGPGAEGTIYQAHIRIGALELRCFDSPAPHDFDFTPSISMFVECDSTAELETLYSTLSAEGAVLMPPDNYGFSARFTWLADRFGVSWQLNVTT